MQGMPFREDGHDFKMRFAGIWSSDVLRARQTADIISEHLPGVPLHEPDPVLAEGKGAVPLPQYEKQQEIT
eukprot:3607607-Amphidinium_carterae.1